jgi:hypothetical protein
LTPGLFDLPAPLLEWVDQRLSAFLPAPVTIALWAVVAGIVCLELYRVVSPQQRIEQLKGENRAAQQRLSAYDGDFEGAWLLIRELLGVSLKRVGIVLPATLVAAYPVLAVLVWMSNSYGYYFPQDESRVSVQTPAPLEARWISGDGTAPQVEARAPGGELVLEQPVPAPVPVLHKRQWWNWLIANPAGYLPADAPVERVAIELPKRQVIDAGPAWLRGWEPLFVAVLFVSALAYKSARRIH